MKGCRALALAVVLFQVGCGLVPSTGGDGESPPARTAEPIALRVGEQRWSETELRRELESIPGVARRSARPGAFREEVDRFVDLLLAEHVAESLGLLNEESLARQLQVIESQARRQKLELIRGALLRYVEARTEPISSELKQYYEDQADRLSGIRVRVRLFSADSKNDVIRLASAGEEDRASMGSDLGWVDTRTVADELRVPIFALSAVGDRSEPFQAKSGSWLVAELVDRDENGRVAFSAARANLTSKLKRNRVADRIRELSAKASEDLGVEIDLTMFGHDPAAPQSTPVQRVYRVTPLVREASSTSASEQGH